MWNNILLKFFSSFIEKNIDIHHCLKYTAWWFYHIGLVNIHYLIYRYSGKKRKHLFVMRTLRIYSFNNFLVYHIAVSAMVMLHITSFVLIYIPKICTSWLPSFSSTYSPTPTSGNHKYNLFFYEFVLL